MKLWFGEPRIGRPLGGSLWEPVIFLAGSAIAVIVAVFLTLIPLFVYWP